MSIFNLDDHRKIWATAQATCGSCGHVWQAVYPEGADLGLECPSCGKMHGVVMADDIVGVTRVLAWMMKNKIGRYSDVDHAVAAGKEPKE